MTNPIYIDAMITYSIAVDDSNYICVTVEDTDRYGDGGLTEEQADALEQAVIRKFKAAVSKRGRFIPGPTVIL